MTSVPFNVGLGDDTRSSSRVLRPPGGGHTDIFGGDPEPPRGRRQNPAAAYATSLGEHQPQNGNAPAQNGQEAAPPAPQAQAEAPAAEPAKPEPVKAAAPAPAPAQEPPKRVRVPPGGFSSGLW
ncbi:skin secretory protein xP2-like [Leguminivora glycinivorella]|uniref:skin secretory protein xP2-like n=1 Tax=Leguminivora glycinivorella TaxID=1035111 RepID=UPI00200F8E97|nr:skin secretory protein xP2-like [Leguminivora glycinivorella]XP_047985339.1 skin secretory protein xP2-like [Leguminivora glycinivorella]